MTTKRTFVVFFFQMPSGAVVCGIMEPGGERFRPGAARRKMRRKNYIKTAKLARSKGTKRVVIALLAAAVLGMLWSLIMGEMGAVKYFRMRARENGLRTEIVRLKEDNLRLMQEVHDLKHDPAYIERLVRDRIGLARPGEVVYYYGDTEK